MGDLTSAASEIGALFVKARASHADTIRHLIACGQKLLEQKGAVGHGEWLLWVHRNRDELGFDDRTAQRLMGAAKQYASLTTDLPDAEAARLSRRIWGNDEPAMLAPAPLAYLGRFSDWIAKHPADEFRGTAGPELLEKLLAARAWCEQLESFIRGEPRKAA